MIPADQAAVLFEAAVILRSGQPHKNRIVRALGGRTETDIAIRRLLIEATRRVGVPRAV